MLKVLIILEDVSKKISKKDSESYNSSVNKQEEFNTVSKQEWLEAIVDQGNQKKKILINIVLPQKNHTTNQRKGISDITSQKISMKRKPESQKETAEIKSSRGSNLLNILLIAANKVAAEDYLQQESKKESQQQQLEQNNKYSIEQKKMENKLKAESNQRSQQLKKYLKMENKYLHLCNLFQEIKSHSNLPH